MAQEAGIYDALWHPENIQATKAEQLIAPLELGVFLLESDPTRFQKFNSPNGWGMYEHFVPFAKKCLMACKEYPNATVRTST